MKRFLLYTISFLMIITAAKAQNVRFMTSGVIEYEKSVNIYAQMKKIINKDNESYMQPAFDAYKRSQPQFKLLKSSLIFSGDKTLFSPIEDQGNTSSDIFFSIPAVIQSNIIYSDLSSGKFITQKKVYEENFLVKDSIRKINWKITGEMRTIAGYECRRANAIVLDSIYVVAFYTDKIPVSAGPESFSGLPGMILGVALPHENISWFAKTITDKPIVAAELKAPVKGKPTDYKGLRTTINAALKNWGNYAQAALKALML